MTRSSALVGGGLPSVAAGSAVGGWTTVGPLPSPRQWPSSQESAVLLDDGTALAAGGAVVRGTGTGECLLFDPKSRSWQPTAGMAQPRLLHSLTKLEDGKVLAVGGMPQTDSLPFTYLATAELYDPARKTWTSAGKLAIPRALHTATLLPGGKVLVAGGTGDQTPGVRRNLRSAEVYDPGSRTWTEVEPMTDARSDHRAVRLTDGRVLLVGGYAGADLYLHVPQSFCELYDPVTGSWAPTGSLRLPRGGHQATPLVDGTVLVTGGFAVTMRRARMYSAHSLWQTELYNPGSGLWTPSGNMPTGRSGHRAVPLRSGRVLVLGGTDAATSDVGYAAAIVYDPRTRAWTPAAGLATGRFYCSATLLATERCWPPGEPYGRAWRIRSTPGTSCPAPANSSPNRGSRGSAVSAATADLSPAAPHRSAAAARPPRP
ncbi:Kelch repeat-containing protein [Streptomyces sp. R28]|uniref:Kelch repeat-containing protein n=1 Tax=Streptomyces sp. R28 TaxID=3238628 RepID=A0AB39QBB8_9ACTN